jgi:hypothetical protein
VRKVLSFQNQLVFSITLESQIDSLKQHRCFTRRFSIILA